MFAQFQQADIAHSTFLHVEKATSKQTSTLSIIKLIKKFYTDNTSILGDPFWRTTFHYRRFRLTELSNLGIA